MGASQSCTIPSGTESRLAIGRGELKGVSRLRNYFPAGVSVSDGIVPANTFNS